MSFEEWEKITPRGSSNTDYAIYGNLVWGGKLTMKRHYGSTRVMGLLEKKTVEESFAERISGVDIRTPTPASEHKATIWFNKVFGEKN